MPFGITTGPEIFQRVMSKILSGLEGVLCHMDDILVIGPDVETHDERVRSVLKKLQEAGMTLNKEKCKFLQTEIVFLGNKVSKNGIAIDEEKVKAITEMKEPTNAKEIMRFLGMLNFVGHSIANKSAICKPLNDLLRKDIDWYWGEKQQQAFDTIKKMVSSAPVLAIFDPNKKTIISSDASMHGLGAALLQEHEEVVRPVAYASRTLNNAERNYANIEREALALTWACVKLENYITGLEIFIETDHKPLVSIFTKKNIDELSPRLQRFRIRLMRFAYKIYYTPGKKLVLADTLSRSPIQVDSDELIEDTIAYVQFIMENVPFSDEKLARVWHEQNCDEVCQKLKEFATSDWPAKETLSPGYKNTGVREMKLLCRMTFS